jgi:hypothetical protein
MAIINQVFIERNLRDIAFPPFQAAAQKNRIAPSPSNPAISLRLAAFRPASWRIWLSLSPENVNIIAFAMPIRSPGCLKVIQWKIKRLPIGIPVIFSPSLGYAPNNLQCVKHSDTMTSIRAFKDIE